MQFLSQVHKFHELNPRVVSPNEKEDDLNPTDDGESAQESHGASNETQLSLRLDLLVSFNVVKGCRVKVNLHQLEG